jgi:hypothetical protein
MSLRQQHGVREAHWANGEMRYDKVETPEGERLFPTLPVRNPSRLRSTVPLAGALTLAHQEPDGE